MENNSIRCAAGPYVSHEMAHARMCELIEADAVHTVEHHWGDERRYDGDDALFRFGDGLVELLASHGEDGGPENPTEAECALWIRAYNRAFADLTDAANDNYEYEADARFTYARAIGSL